MGDKNSTHITNLLTFYVHNFNCAAVVAAEGRKVGSGTARARIPLCGIKPTRSLGIPSQ